MAFFRSEARSFLSLFLLGGLLGMVRVAGLIITKHNVDGLSVGTLSYLLFLPSPPTVFSATMLAPLNPPAWSLMFELWINVAYALALPRLTGQRLWAFVAVAAVALFTTIVMAGTLDQGSKLDEIWIGAARVCFSFPIGVLIYRYRERLPAVKMSPVLLPVLLIVAFSIPASPLTNGLFVFVVAPTLVICAIGSGPRNFTSWYGSIASYCIYAIHFPLLVLASGISDRMHIESRYVAVFVVAGVLILSPFIDILYDRPLRKWLSLRAGLARIPGR